MDEALEGEPEKGGFAELIIGARFILVLCVPLIEHLSARLGDYILRCCFFVTVQRRLRRLLRIATIRVLAILKGQSGQQRSLEGRCFLLFFCLHVCIGC